METNLPIFETTTNGHASATQHPRRKSRRVMIGNIPVGDGAPISVQSMTKTKTGDVDATVAQIARMEEAGVILPA